MSDVERRFHETWLGMVQPVEGLVVSIPVLIEAQCMERQPPETQKALLDCSVVEADGRRRISDIAAFFEAILGHLPSHFDAGDDLPKELSVYVQEGGQTIAPSMALRRAPEIRGDYVALVWSIDSDLDFEKPETKTGPWHYPPAAKLDRLLRHARVPIGILTNGRAIRLIYAPHGESTGSVTFRVDDMASVTGRPILDALVMLLSARRFYSVAESRSLPKLLEQSRKHQGDVTNELAEQVFEAIEFLLAGFEQAAERDGSTLLREAVGRGDDHVYGGLLTVLLRLVFVLYAESWDLLPIESPVWSKSYSVIGLFEELQADRGAFPDSMARRFGAWGRLLALFRAIFLGVSSGDIQMPPRRGNLFDPHRFPFLEGWGPGGGAPINDAEARAAVRVPTVDDETVYRVLERLILYGGQRLSYRALDVEQLGSVYEWLMGYRVVCIAHDAVALRVKNKASAARAWVEVARLLEEPAARRSAWLEDDLGFDKANAKKAADAIKPFDSSQADAAIETLLATARAKDKSRLRASAGRLVLQPGPERRRTSSHYTPRELTGPIVQKTLEPLLRVMGEAPSSERILSLKVCDPAMGSGAFLVEACRFLGDEVLKAWTREGKLAELPPGDPLLYAKRMVAQQCLYGVDKNPWAVDLAKLSLWLVTLAKELPFTFVDHALAYGDSLVGLDFDQIRAGHWKPEKQVTIAEVTLREALDEAIAIRQKILTLAGDPSPEAQREKERLMADAKDATAHARLLADLIVASFFSHEKQKDRERARADYVDAFMRFKSDDSSEMPDDLVAIQREIRRRLPIFHWMLEFPEVFFAERPDPLDEDRVNRAANMDAFFGNPPFSGKNGITNTNGEGYLDWLLTVHEEAHGNADLAAHFFRRAHALLGDHGTVGLIATNTIAQGDTRSTGLKWLVNRGSVIYEAQRSMSWPGDAAVAVSLVHLATGAPACSVGAFTLDGAGVSAINSRLRGSPERPDPVVLKSNADKSFQGAIILGTGFILRPEEREALVASNPHNAARISPYLGGEEVNTSPTQEFDRYVINFGQLDLAAASEWPDLLEIVRERVKPERDTNKRDVRRVYWWRFGEVAPALHETIASLERCLVTSRVSKHLLLSFQSVDRVFSDRLYVFSLQQSGSFAVLQSRVHEPWARLLSSTLEERLNYSASDCFETFPFPRPDPNSAIPGLETVGERLYSTRSEYMVAENVGLTVTYNRLKDPNETDPRIVELRRLHEEMDGRVLDAYGWGDITVPPFCIGAESDKKALEAFEDEVIDRLFVLNAERAEEERLLRSETRGKKRGGKIV